MANVTGIDLGTTYSALALLNSIGKPKINSLIDIRLPPYQIIPKGSGTLNDVFSFFIEFFFSRSFFKRLRFVTFTNMVEFVSRHKKSWV